MNLNILNRAADGGFQHPADGWYQIEAKGYHPAVTTGGEQVVQVIDDKAIASIVNKFNQTARSGALRHGKEMLVDREHFKHDADKGTEAYAWMAELQNRGDGIYSRQRWTDTGKPAVDGGTYRFFSTEYEGAMEDVPAAQIPADVRNKYPDRRFVRPLELTGLSLTNMNRNRGQHGITNRDDTNFPGPSGSADEQTKTKGQKMKSVCNLLGLSADASEEAVHAAVTKLMNRNTTLEPLVAENTTLKNRNTELEGEQCDVLMTAHGLDATKDAARREKLKPVLVGLKNREDRESFLKDVVTAPAAPAAAPQTKLFNRDTQPPQKGSQKQKDEAAQSARATKIMNRATQLQKDVPGLSHATAVIQAQREIENAE